MYATKTELAKLFKMSRPTVYKRVAGIEKEIGKRYGRYAICNKLVSVVVFLDYEKYHEYLEDKNLRKNIPDFNMTEAMAYLKEIKNE